MSARHRFMAADAMSVALAEAQEESRLTGDQLLVRAVARRTGVTADLLA